MLDVVVLVVGEDQDVIQVDDDELEHNVLKDIVDEVLKAGRRVCEAETHDKGLKKTLGRAKAAFHSSPSLIRTLL